MCIVNNLSENSAKDLKNNLKDLQKHWRVTDLHYFKKNDKVLLLDMV